VDVELDVFVEVGGMIGTEPYAAGFVRYGSVIVAINLS
jgi:hypothetical protein